MRVWTLSLEQRPEIFGWALVVNFSDSLTTYNLKFVFIAFKSVSFKKILKKIILFFLLKINPIALFYNIIMKS